MRTVEPAVPTERLAAVVDDARVLAHHHPTGGTVAIEPRGLRARADGLGVEAQRLCVLPSLVQPVALLLERRRARLAAVRSADARCRGHARAIGCRGGLPAAATAPSIGGGGAAACARRAPARRRRARRLLLLLLPLLLLPLLLLPLLLLLLMLLLSRRTPR